MIIRRLESRLRYLLRHFPAVVLLGPRQAGKTTLARVLAAERPAVYLDLEDPRDRARISDARTTLSEYADRLVVLDEVQRAPEIFQILRGLIDEGRRTGYGNGRFLLLGSASLELLQQSESLAGRIAFVELTPFDALEVTAADQDLLWVRGGFPSSFLAPDDAISMLWRQNFIATYLERDVPQFGFRVPAETLRRFWTMLAHQQCELLNASRLASSLGVESKSVARYVDMLVDLLLVRRLQPWSNNDGKRLVKSPKLYVRDTGLVHTLLRLQTKEDVLSHPVAGQTFEGVVIETLLACAPSGTSAYFYRTAAGAEIDLILELPHSQRWAIEIKRSSVPKVAKGFHLACEDLQPQRRLLVYSGVETFGLGQGVEAIPLRTLAGELVGLN